MLWPVLGMSPEHTMSAEILRDGSKKEKEMQTKIICEELTGKKKNGTCIETGAALVAEAKNRRDKRRIILTKATCKA